MFCWIFLSFVKRVSRGSNDQLTAGAVHSLRDGDFMMSQRANLQCLELKSSQYDSPCVLYILSACFALPFCTLLLPLLLPVITVLQHHLQAFPIHKAGITSRNLSASHLIVSLALLNRTLSSRCSSGGQTLKTTNELMFFLGPHSLAVNLKEWLGVKPSGSNAPLSVF